MNATTIAAIKETFFGAIRDAEGGLIQWVPWAEWVDRLRGEFDPEMDAHETVEQFAVAWCYDRVIGSGEPLAVAWQDGFGSLFRAGATEEEIRNVALSFLPCDDPSDDDEV